MSSFSLARRAGAMSMSPYSKPILIRDIAAAAAAGSAGSAMLCYASVLSPILSVASRKCYKSRADSSSKETRLAGVHPCRLESSVSGEPVGGADFESRLKFAAALPTDLNSGPNSSPHELPDPSFSSCFSFTNVPFSSTSLQTSR